jgi:hypothetical protein
MPVRDTSVTVPRDQNSSYVASTPPKRGGLIMEDHGVALSNLAKQAPFIKLTAEQEQQVKELIAKISAIFNQQQAKKAS